MLLNNIISYAFLVILGRNSEKETLVVRFTQQAQRETNLSIAESKTLKLNIFQSNTERRLPAMISVYWCKNTNTVVHKRGRIIIIIISSDEIIIDLIQFKRSVKTIIQTPLMHHG